MTHPAGFDYAVQQQDGWSIAPGVWSYASATTITVPTGAASIYAIGDKIKLTQTTAKYFYVVAVADTLLTVTGGSDYSVANAAITSPYYSKAVAPVGFPSSHNYTTAWTASGTAPAIGNGTIASSFSLVGGMMYVQIKLTAGSTTTFGTGLWLFSNPVNPTKRYIGNGLAYDSSAGTEYGGISVIASPSSSTMYAMSGTNYLGPTVPFTWATSDVLDLAVNYPI